MRHEVPRERVRVAPASFLCALLVWVLTLMGSPAFGFTLPSIACTQRSVATSDGVKLSVCDAQPPNVPTAQVLVFVPGWTMPSELFAAQIAHFSKRARVVTIDPRGQGRSEVPPQGYTLERRAQDIADVLTALDLSNVVLIGWSLGVLESLHLSTQPAASRIAAYVLIDNSVGEATPPKGDPNFFTNLRSKRGDTVQRFVSGMFKTPQHPSYVGHIAQQSQRMSVEASVSLLSYPKAREYWRESLYGISRPVAYFVTAKFFAQADAVAVKRPDTFIKKFPNAGHALFVDDPTGFNSALAQFLNTVK